MKTNWPAIGAGQHGLVLAHGDGLKVRGAGFEVLIALRDGREVRLARPRAAASRQHTPRVRRRLKFALAGGQQNGGEKRGASPRSWPDHGSHSRLSNPFVATLRLKRSDESVRLKSHSGQLCRLSDVQHGTMPTPEILLHMVASSNEFEPQTKPRVETVLVVDDDVLIRLSIAGYLRGLRLHRSLKRTVPAKRSPSSKPTSTSTWCFPTCRCRGRWTASASPAGCAPTGRGSG